MGIGNGKATQPARVGGERLYPFPDQDLGVRGADQAVVARHVRRYTEAVRAAYQVVGDGACWLDIACGSGYGAPVVAKKNPKTYTGVDWSEEAIRYADRHFASGSGIGFIERDITRDPPGASEYDAVLSIETVEHLLRDEQRVFVRNLWECLRPGGALVISCPVGDETGKSENPFHLHEPSLSEIRSYMGDHLQMLHVERTEGTFGDFLQCYAVGVKE